MLQGVVVVLVVVHYKHIGTIMELQPNFTAQYQAPGGGRGRGGGGGGQGYDSEYRVHYLESSVG